MRAPKTMFEDMDDTSAARPRPRARRSVHTFFASVVFLAGCRAPATEAEILPFRIAVAPFDVDARSSDVARDGREARFRLEFDAASLAQAIAPELDDFVFTEVVALPLPEGVDSRAYAGWPQNERDAYIEEAALAADADLLLDGDFIYDPEVHFSIRSGPRNRALLPTALLTVAAASLSGGPSAILFVPLVTLAVRRWSEDDRVYGVELAFDGALHDCRALADPRTGATLGNRRAELLRLTDSTAEAALDFDSRANFSGRIASFVVPTGYVGGSAEREHEALRDAIVKSMLEDWVAQFGARRKQLFAAEELVPFEVVGLLLDRTEGAGARQAGWCLRGEVHLDTARLDVMDGYRVWVDESLVADETWVDADRVEDGRAVFSLDVPLGGLTESGAVALEVRDGALRQGVRTFSFRAGRTGTRVRRRIDPDLGPVTRSDRAQLAP